MPGVGCAGGPVRAHPEPRYLVQWSALGLAWLAQRLHRMLVEPGMSNASFPRIIGFAVPSLPSNVVNPLRWSTAPGPAAPTKCRRSSHQQGCAVNVIVGTSPFTWTPARGLPWPGGYRSHGSAGPAATRPAQGRSGRAPSRNVPFWAAILILGECPEPLILRCSCGSSGTAAAPVPRVVYIAGFMLRRLPCLSRGAIAQSPQNR